MVCAPVRSIISSLKLGDCLFVLAHKPCTISHLYPLHFRRFDDPEYQDKLARIDSRERRGPSLDQPVSSIFYHDWPWQV